MSPNILLPPCQGERKRKVKEPSSDGHSSHVGKLISRGNMPNVEQSFVSRLKGALSCTWVARVWMWVAQWDVWGVENSLASGASLPRQHLLFYINPVL